MLILCSSHSDTLPPRLVPLWLGITMGFTEELMFLSSHGIFSRWTEYSKLHNKKFISLKLKEKHESKLSLENLNVFRENVLGEH